MLIKDVQWECRTAGFLRVSVGAGYIKKSCSFDVHTSSLSIHYYKHLQMFSILHWFLRAFYSTLTELKEMLRYIKTLLTYLGEKEGLNTKPGLLETPLQLPSFETCYFQA